MKKMLGLALIGMMIAILVACGASDNDNDSADGEEEELAVLDVDFEVPEKADLGETVELTTTVNYGGEEVADADEVVIEYWIHGNENDSTKVETQNNGDGTYTVEVTFEEDAVYELYAHTTAHDLHTMPKANIVVGDAEPIEMDDTDNMDDMHMDEEDQMHDTDEH